MLNSINLVFIFPLTLLFLKIIAFFGDQKKPRKSLFLLFLKPLSVTTNVIGLQTASAGNMVRRSSLQNDAVVVMETGFFREIPYRIGE